MIFNIFKTQLFLTTLTFNEFSFLIMMLDTSKRRVTLLLKNERKLFLVVKSNGPLLAGLPLKWDFHSSLNGVNLNGGNEWTAFVCGKS